MGWKGWSTEGGGQIEGREAAPEKASRLEGRTVQEMQFGQMAQNGGNSPGGKGRGGKTIL